MSSNPDVLRKADGAVRPKVSRNAQRSAPLCVAANQGGLRRL
jgi:hypothetical protein